MLADMPGPFDMEAVQCGARLRCSPIYEATTIAPLPFFDHEKQIPKS
jgi:hypothetical protein